MNAIPKIYALGHRHTTGILKGEVRVQEKIDGSQFSFQWLAGSGLECRSKGAAIHPCDNSMKMFKQAVDFAQALADNGQLPSGFTFQCEYLQKPKHNVLAYACIPAGHLVLFDVRNAAGEYLPDEVDAWAKVLGVTPVPTFYCGGAHVLLTPESSMSRSLYDYLEHESVLGGCKIEGLVIKNYGKQHAESQSGAAPMTAKIVSDRFKEKHASSPINPKAKQGELITAIVARYRTEARWLKAIQHLKEAGKLVNGPEDIGPLLAEIQQDTLTEDGHDIAELLFAEQWKNISRGICEGFPQYYKKLVAGGAPSVWQELQINKTNEKETNETN